MCIRDSLDVVRRALARLAAPGAFGPVALDLLTAGVAVGDAVSYTHLRAHETVLDLVCRLLLEKKKNIGLTSHSPQHPSINTQYTD